jgi:nickel/cobalt transporter (NiCoT) family protein
LLVLPLLFAAGMSPLPHSGRYVHEFCHHWAFSHLLRKLYYNITITGP